MSFERKYQNFLEIRRKETSNFLWISRRWVPIVAFKQGKHSPTPESHKKSVLQSPTIQNLLDQISARENVPKATLETQVCTILDEIGYERKFKIIRWLGLVLTKICLKVLSGIYINVDQVEMIKQKMGDCPVVFVPTHRSYNDFIMMSYVTFTYDIEMPVIAAGMDFHSMWGMGTMLRDTGAFFMRRSYNNDSLYWTTFRQYIYQLVSKGDAPIEFFIEGTRSRSNKALSPKYGLLTMILKAFFVSQVPDILFVPIGISYDRILEENLFAFELLGVPKPKESTSGFFKSMKIIKEKFGDIYVHMDEPISARQFFGDKINRNGHSLGPLSQQEISPEEKKALPSLAYEIVKRQQKILVLTIFNLVALVLNNVLTYHKAPVTVEELTEEVRWIQEILNSLGGFTRSGDLARNVEKALNIHQNLVTVDKDNRLRLIHTEVSQSEINPKKLKAHALNDTLMTHCVPFVMLQIYANPALNHLIDLNVILMILGVQVMDEDELFDNYYFLRSVFSREFVILSAKDRTVFNKALDQAAILNLVTESNGSYRMGNNSKLQDFVINAFLTFYLSYDAVLVVLQQLPHEMDEKSILVNAQKLLEGAIAESTHNIHPYSLNLDTLVNCLSSLCDFKVLRKSKRDNTNIYEINFEILAFVKEKLEKIIPQYSVLRNYRVVFVEEELKNKL